MDALELTNATTNGVVAGLNYSIGMLSDTLNNQYLWTIATMFIGIAIVIGVVMFFLKGHRRV